MIKSKGISPLISVVLLVVVAIIIVTIILNWGQNVTQESLNKANEVNNDITQVTTHAFDVVNLIDNKLIIKNTSGSDYVITGFKISSTDADSDLLNTDINLDSSITIKSGELGQVDLPIPAGHFDIELITSDNKYITILDVLNRNSIGINKTYNINRKSIPVENVLKNDRAIVTSDGGFFIATSSNISEPTRLQILKYDNFYNLEWEKVFDDVITDNFDPYFIQTKDGGYAIFSKYYIDSKFQDYIMLKLDGQGNEDWNLIYSHTYEDVESKEVPSDIIQTSDGGYLVAFDVQVSTGAISLLKIDARGNKDWTQVYEHDKSYLDSNAKIVERLDGNYIMVFENGDKSTISLVFYLLDKSGNNLVDLTVDNEVYQSISDIIYLRDDSGFIVIGSRVIKDENCALVIKMDRELGEEPRWTTTFEGREEQEMFAKKVIELDNGNIIIGADTGAEVFLQLLETTSGSKISFESTPDKGYFGRGTLMGFDFINNSYKILAKYGETEYSFINANSDGSYTE